MSDYFSPGVRRRGNTLSTVTTRNDEEARPGATERPVSSYGARNLTRIPSNIRIRRLPSSSTLPTNRPPSRQSYASSNDGAAENLDEVDEPDDFVVSGRRRSSSAPQRYAGNLAPPNDELLRQRTPEPAYMQTIAEGGTLTPRDGAAATRFPPVASARDFADSAVPPQEPAEAAPSTSQPGQEPLRVRPSRRFRSNTVDASRQDEYSTDVIDLLDLIDPEVSTLGTLTNVQNSLFIPDLGGLVNRRPTYELSPRPTTTTSEGITGRSRAGTRVSIRRPLPKKQPSQIPVDPSMPKEEDIEMHPPRRTLSIDSRMSESRYAVLPHGISLDDWADEDIEELNDHVRHLLHSRREGFKRKWKGFKKYVSHPLGLFVTVYAVLVTLFGTAWVFCLIGWIYVGSKQDYFIDVIDNVLVALFALIGDGMAPFRAVDTYHMCFIAHYHHLTWRLRKEQQLPKLVDRNDLPVRRLSAVDVADVVDKAEVGEVSVLDARQQARLQYHQAKFSKTHTFYRSHETATHHAFPLRYLVAIVVLLDFHSLFQIALGTCTWSIHYTVRPQALTATILAMSLSCNIAAGIVISMGDRKTRKKEVLERIYRQGLTEEAIRTMQKRRTDDIRVSLDLNALAEDIKDGSAPPVKPAKLMSSGSREHTEAFVRATAARKSSEWSRG